MAGRIGSALVSMLGVGACVLALCPAGANAAWALGKCADRGGSHCYALAVWKPEAAADILNTWSYIDTTEMYVPEPEQNFVTNEQWTTWKKLWDWVEAGQMAGRQDSPTQIRSFYAVLHDEDEYEEIIGPATSFDSRNFYQFYSEVPGEDEAKPGEDWCIKWGGPIFPASQEGTVRCVHEMYGPSTELQTGVEAATERQPANRGSSEGFAAAGKNDLWQETANEKSHATRYHEEIKVGKERVGEATCASKLGRPGYGSLYFGAGEGCPEALEEGEEGGDALQADPAFAASGGEAFATDQAAPGVKPISPASAARIAEKEATRDGGAPAGAVTVAEGTLDSALEVMRPGSMKEVRASASAAEIAYLAGSVDLVEAHGSFTLADAPVPPGAHAPVGTVLRLLVNADTGEIEGRSLADTPGTPIDALGVTRQIG